MQHDVHASVLSRRARIGAAVLILVGAAIAQERETPTPKRLTAFFWHDSPNDVAALEGIRAALAAAQLPHELSVLQADSDQRRGIELLASVGPANCDLLFAMGTQAALLAREHLRGVPIVYTAVTNPVVSCVVPSWEGSGTRIAGSSIWISPATILHVFRAAVPRLTRLGMLRSRSSGVVSAAELAAMRAHLGKQEMPPIEILERVVDDAGGITAAARELIAAGVQAIWVPIDFTIYTNMPAVRAAVAGTGVPILSSSLQGAREGAAAGVVVDYRLLGQRAAAIALDVLRGKRIGEIPADTMESYQVVVGVGAAREARYELPLSLLVIADELIDPGVPAEPRDGR
jgi:putative ABC transport system substrate-binding protein